MFNALRRHKGRSFITFVKAVVFSFRILRNLRAQRDILKILTIPSFKGIANLQPRFPFKYMSKLYLASGLTLSERAAAQTHHYRYLHAALCDTFLHDVLYGGAAIYEAAVGDNSYAIMLSLSQPYDYEGELSLELRHGGTTIFVLSFTIVHGSIVDANAEDAILITRMQGVCGLFQSIRTATKDMHDTSPTALTFCALSGIALALDINCIAGVSSANHRASSMAGSEWLESAYDEFFSSLGATQNARGFFCFQVPLREKPITLVRRDHRSRTKKKRAFKREISETVRRDFLQNVRIPRLSEAAAKQALRADDPVIIAALPAVQEYR
jgi:uncharacterized protein VirK/YbjX